VWNGSKEGWTVIGPKAGDNMNKGVEKLGRVEGSLPTFCGGV